MLLLASTAVAGWFGPAWEDGFRVVTTVLGAGLVVGGRLARDAAAMYAELESGELRRKVTMLEGELQAARPPSGRGAK